MPAEPSVLTRHDGRVGRILLNRPKTLNALDLPMIRAITHALQTWRDDPHIHAVVIEAAGDRAFCAGGDIRAIYEAGRGISGDRELTSVFFREEYEIIRHIHRFPKPYLAIIDGITMGGGAGVSVNGAYRIATERTLVAMPETGIGLFPDVGATRFLNLCPGHIGRYLGLTGARLGPADALYCGFATHFVPRGQVPTVVEELGRVAWQAGAAAQQVEDVLARFSADPGVPPLAARRAAIDRCFGLDTVEAIVAALDREAASGGTDSEWAAETRAGLQAKSPTSLKITLRQLIVGRRFGIEDALALEYRLTQHMMASHDFYEGVRAVVIDKDQKPRWHPGTLAEVTEAIVDSYFSPIGDYELKFS
jgi:enoyl-CoA hydratase